MIIRAAIRHYANQPEIFANLWIAFVSSSSGGGVGANDSPIVAGDSIYLTKHEVKSALTTFPGVGPW